MKIVSFLHKVSHIVVASGHVTSEDGFKMMETNKSILPAEAKEGEKHQFCFGKLF